MVKGVTGTDYWANAMQIGFVMAEAHGVIAMRVMGALGLWSVPRTENSRMLNEKVFAFVKGSADASLAAFSGASPNAITAAAIKPVRKATYSNHKRLTKRGLRRA